MERTRAPIAPRDQARHADCRSHGGRSAEERRCQLKRLRAPPLSVTADHVIGADAPKVEPLAAGDDRREKFFGIGGCEDETSMRWRLFQRLEEGVGGCSGDLVRLVDDIDLRAELSGRVPDTLS